MTLGLLLTTDMDSFRFNFHQPRQLSLPTFDCDEEYRVEKDPTAGNSSYLQWLGDV